MAGNYEYKPKGIDIRVNKGKKKVDPNEMECDWAGCVSMGGCKAPKSPDRLREYYNSVSYTHLTLPTICSV